ncbi:MAG: NIL domain-containing protein [Verrucomicrobiales bacterium]|jgi:ABC-type methionine transport system ATPase subunit|nr:NIL domain-containing protein [Verrucomicrobiales bacterium]
MAKESKRYWLTFDSKGVRRPLIWEMSKKFDVVFDIRSATVTPLLGIMAIELSGDGDVIAATVKWLKRRGVQVDPI